MDDDRQEGSYPALSPWRHFAVSCRLSDVRFALLLAAIAVYACFSSPTPDDPGLAEGAVALLLALAIGPRQAVLSLLPPAGGALWRWAAWMLLLYGLTVPVLGGLMRGHDLALIVRDIIPFLFFTMPLFLADLLTARPSYAPAVTGAVALAGLAFALRLLVPSFIAYGHVGFSALPGEDPLYLANAPTVLFMTILALALAGQEMGRGRLRSIVPVAAMTGAGMVCVLAMAAVMQRASLGLGMACLAALWALLFVRAPGRAMKAVLPLALVVLLLYPQFAALARHLLLKTSLVGFNNRPQEAALVFSMVGRHWADALFGLGWGQTIASPAVGDVTVNYTHTMPTALWLKTGLAGLTLAGLYVAGLSACLWRILWWAPVLCLAIAAPCLIDLTLYANYKSFDFGLMLMLIPLWASRVEKLRRPGQLLYAGRSPLTIRRPAPSSGGQARTRCGRDRRRSKCGTR